MMSFLTDWLFDYVIYLSLIVLFASFYYYSTSTYGKWKKLNIPYIPPVPLFGNTLRMMMKLEQQVDLFDRIYNRFPNAKLFGFYQMREPMLMVCDPELIHTILVKDFSYFTDHGFIMEPSTSVLGNSLFFANGQRWRTMRQKLSPGFTSGKLKDAYSQINECSEEMVSKIVDTIEKKTDQINVKTMTSGLSTDVIGTCAFGMKLDTIKNDDSEFRWYAKKLFQRSTKQIIVQIITTICPFIIKLFKIQMFPVDSINFFYKVFTDVINYREEHNVIRNDLTQTLIQARKELVLKENSTSADKYTDADIISNAILMFASGSESIPSMLSFCLYELALNKEIQDKLRAEICSMRAKHNGQFNNDYLRDLHYTDMVLEETGRKYSLAQILMREATKTYTLRDESFVIEKGQKLIIPIFSIHRDPKYYPDPLRFDPERFSMEQKSQRPNGIYLPFGDGPRFCIDKFTNDDIIGNAIVMFAAGSETVSSVLSFCLYELALNIEIQDRLRTEIYSMKTKHDGQLNNDYLTDLHYASMVLEETARKYSVALNIMRVSTKSYTLPDKSFVIEKGQKLIIPMFSIHRDPKYYPDPLRFDPERFSAEHKSQRPNGTYMPFGDGPRLCIGKRFAESEMKLALSNLLSKFEVLPCEQTEIPLNIRNGLGLITAKNGVVLKFRPIIEH